MEIRKATEKDIPRILSLLEQVLDVHAKLRPDLFVPNTTKYTADELAKIIENENTPIFVAVDDEDITHGYAFTQLVPPQKSNVLKEIYTLYLDDLCVDEECRGQAIGKQLFEYVVAYAKEKQCHNLTLNVWEGNDIAKHFYEANGMQVQKTYMEMVL